MERSVTDTVKSRIDELTAEHGILLKKILAKGTFSRVFLGVCDGKEWAIKVIKTNGLTHTTRKFLKREMKICMMMKHAALLRTHKVVQHGNRVIFVQDFCEGGSLLEKVQQATYDEEEAKIPFRQLIEGVGFLHQQNIIHRDLKCENILLDKQENLIIGDFGFARFVQNNEECSSFCGSRAYSCPEILLNEKYDGKKADVWALGAILFIMVTGEMPFVDDSNIVESQKSNRLLFPSKIDLSKHLKMLLYAMLNPNKEKRLGCREIHSHYWMSNTPFVLKIHSYCLFGTGIMSFCRRCEKMCPVGTLTS